MMARTAARVGWLLSLLVIPASATTFLPLPAPAGYKAGAVERFTAENAFEKIDGAAEGFLAYGMVGLEMQSFAKGDQSIDVEIYDMATPLSAFGVLMDQHNGKDPVELGQDGYSNEGSVFFRADRYYARVIAPEGEGADPMAALTLAKALAAKLPTTKFTAPGATWFPTQDLQPNTVKWVMKSGLATDFLTDLYVGGYKVGDTPSMDGFLAKRAKDADAAALLAQYKAYLPRLGTVTAATVAGQACVVCLGQDGKTCCIAFAKGSVFGGVSSAPNRGAAETVTARLVAAAGNIQ
jgi:hypothetical protein